MGVVYVSGKEPSFVAGRDPASDLVIEDPGVSRRHLELVMITGDAALIRVHGTNGAIVGGRHVKKGYRGYVRTGDLIRVGGCDMVFTGLRESPSSDFIRSYKCPAEPEAEPVEIEGPPQRRVPEKPSLMLAAGPALTMAIPILLGAGRTIAVLSSVFAGMWAAFNVLGRVRKQKTEERRRRNAYMTYLDTCEEEIKKRMEQVNITLNRIYPAVGNYLKAGGDPFILWNKMPDSEGGVMVRTGTGRVANPVRINVPKERFAAIDDSLRELPGRLRSKYESLSGCPVRVRLSDSEIPAFDISSEKGRQMLSSAILQLAVSYPPDMLKLDLHLRKESMRYYMWTYILPHHRLADEEGAGDGSEGCRSVLVTDDVQLACRALSEGAGVLFAGYGRSNIPQTICTLIGEGGEKAGFRPDTVPRKLCFSYAGRLSALWGMEGEDTAIPETVPFGRLFDGDIGRVIESNYEEKDITRDISVPLGQGAGGRRIYLDLHEKAQGPHGVIAGTTGSGKSELLTTLILSLAASFPPEKLAFFLIDYKGGGMSNLFEELPHLAGSISNLSKALSQRAMTALKSENVRRQKIFAEANVNNINDYTGLYDEGKVTEPLPHLIIIVDEFAELRKEEPEFMDRLISISQVGRSLGMHLILATQKPAGVVDDKIRANSGFKIALRMVDRADSMDLIGRPDAVTIKERGRALLQTAAGADPVCFQSGYAMGPALKESRPIRLFCDLLLDEEIKTDTYEGPKEGRTWYRLCMDELKKLDGLRNVPKGARLWLPFLPDRIEDDEAFAVFDDPYRQKYEKALYEPERLGHLLIAGKSGTGKSELVLAIINRLSGKAAVYMIDHGGGKAAAVADEAWCGGYIDEEMREDTVRLTGFICELVMTRRKMKAAGPPVILVLDDMPDILERGAGEVRDHVLRILTLGRSVGVYVLATSVVARSERIYDLFDTRLYMGNDDPYTVSAFLGGAMRSVPIVQDSPGRGIGVMEGKLLEFQAVRSRIRGKPPPSGLVAAKYPHVPDDPSLEEFMDRAVYELPCREGAGDFHLPAGYDIKSGKLYMLPLGLVNCILVTGKAYSGRHTFLFDISVTAARYGIECIQADTYEALISQCRLPGKTKIIRVESMTALIKDFYSKERSADLEEELATFLENPLIGRRKPEAHPVIVGIIENDARTLFSGKRVFEAMIRHPYGISFGGCLDENRVLDFSYLPYSTMQMSQCRCCATVLKFDEKSFSGAVKIPSKINVDNLENM